MNAATQDFTNSPLVEGWLAVKRDGVYLEKRNSQYLQNYMRLPLATTPRPSGTPLKEGNLIRATGCIKTALLFVFFLAVCGNATDEWKFDYETKDKFTTGERWATFGLNLIPGLGSMVIMGDWVGAVPQWVLSIAGAYSFYSYIDSYREIYVCSGEVRNGRCYDGSRIIGGYYDDEYDDKYSLLCVGFLASSFIYNIYRSITYDKPQKTAFGENSGFNLAVLPNRNGKLNAFLMYNKVF